MNIELKGVVKKYGAEKALDNVTLYFEPGKIYGLLGPNGSGKSTTLKLITGLVYPNSGTVTVLQEKVTRRISKKVAYLTELDMFYDSFTTGKMIEFYDSQFPDFDRDKAFHLLKEMELPENKKIKQLSKGNRGRLKLVLTLARDVPVVLLDEPFSGLDPMVRDSIVTSLLTYINFEKQTVIIATHEIDEIEQIMDEVIAIYNGDIISRQNVEAIREEQGLSVLEWFKSIMRNKGKEV
ncbi:ABC-2 type transport system ATP-binding protein [Bacillus thermophilus]|uniref:ABC-2 type transport system ATP-binding protein n=1 Tax=Siminovitchia thermophila TaxID=1245522 RepID=A0ABS2R2E3_9BACI|nr:ABC transporter ATP-binding protein [Siminovitchia thermophila]MBM7713083.1 ABC-2 type transport system ATP-binding protein [Siminovitchia thermophila]ONK24878.1 spermidine/putrescine ABC transporter ATP-binding protein [Bacillus sp. VT-16-64]